MTEEVTGRFVGHTCSSGELRFMYEYTCEQCKRTFRSTASESTRPIVCELCFHYNDSLAKIESWNKEKARKKKCLEKKRGQTSHGST